MSETSDACVIHLRRERHPDIFRPEEAVEYLALDSVRSLETIRKDFGLMGVKHGKGFLYHRTDLDRCAMAMFGIRPRGGLAPTTRSI